MTITITAESIPELHATIEQLQRFNELQRHAKRLCVGGKKNFDDAMTTLGTIKADTQPGESLEQASILAGGWLETYLTIDGEQVSIDAALAELIVRYQNVRDYMQKIQSSYAAIGGGEFFPGM